jgi:CDP-archaeol synthase
LTDQESMHFALILQLLLLLLIANGTPVIAKRLFGDFLAWPVDAGCKFTDGRALFGPSKTIRGLVLAILLTSGFAAFTAIPWHVGAVVGATAMLGDLVSSFAKRRMNLEPSAMAIGLDQIPESLLPLLVSWPLLGTTMWDVVITTIIFFIGELVLSRLLFVLRIRDRPF